MYCRATLAIWYAYYMKVHNYDDNNEIQNK